jgi:hypothetical protein
MNDKFADFEEGSFDNSGYNSSKYLSVLQPLSQAVTDNPATVYAGQFYVEGLGALGSSVGVVVLAHKIMWQETNDKQKLVGRYLVGSVPVIGESSFTGLTRADNGNKIEDVWLYALLLYKHPEAGVIVYSGRSTNIKYLRKWNKEISNIRLSDGRKAAPFASVWSLNIEKNKNANNQTYFSLGKDKDPAMVWEGFLDEEFYDKWVAPVRHDWKDVLKPFVLQQQPLAQIGDLPKDNQKAIEEFMSQEREAF